MGVAWRASVLKDGRYNVPTFEDVQARFLPGELWVVRFLSGQASHAVDGVHSRWTACGEWFDPDTCAIRPPPVTCEACLEALGCLPVGV